ncbi:mitochondrial intermembrane space import and assembly protein 40-like [Orbicella faveolata]|uniref:mitochondrial intermembrane space import and assembly protein 40-like n=1 Tax=Orbicella faveolata TaxID=48498 RepID=UPI0009E650D0|nr:mitochondrial intermembrane space import and assembly protein 40-like [Orbicella faveolata]
MSYCREEGKDKLMFVTEEDHATPSSVTLEEDDEEELEGLIKANGEINWDCPCLQGMAYGPCGEQFKAAFSCFHYSEADPKGSDCIPQFRDMQECFVKYPEIYGKDDELDEEEDSINMETENVKAGDGEENIVSSEKNDYSSSDSTESTESTHELSNEASS